MATRPVDRYLVTLRQLLPELAEKYHVRSLEVFGSYVRDELVMKSALKPRIGQNILREAVPV